MTVISNSSTIYARGYDPSTSTLHVQFQWRGANEIGPLYEYSNFPKNLWDEWLAAESAGKFFAAVIKTNFTGIKIPQPKVATPPAAEWMEEIARDIEDWFRHSYIGPDGDRSEGGSRDFVIQKLTQAINDSAKRGQKLL